MKPFNKLELTLILAFYYLDKGKNIDSFTHRFTQYFHRDIGASTVLFSLSKFKNVDPSNNVQKTGEEDDIYALLWKEYITSERIADLRSLYRTFKNGQFVESIAVDDDKQFENIEDVKPTEIKDIPCERPTNYQTGHPLYPRSREVVANVLCSAGYKCENDCSTELFVRKNGENTYTEAHHLIPVCFQGDFEYSLDVEANVVSLCPNCHCRIHYGEDIEKMLRSLYLKRKNRLESCGLRITFEELLLLYR